MLFFVGFIGFLVLQTPGVFVLAIYIYSCFIGFSRVFGLLFWWSFLVLATQRPFRD